MKSLGNTLKSAREERDITIGQAVHETNISRNYLEALENEDFSEFPAETYLVGFLRSYADFLGLDADKAVGQFKNYKLNEDPTPIEELVGPPKGLIARRIFLWIFLALLLVALGFLGFPRLATMFREFKAQRLNRISTETIAPKEIRPNLPLWEGQVRPGDTLVLEGSNVDIIINLSNSNEKLVLDGGTAGQWSMFLGEEIYIPDENGQPAWRLYLKDFGIPDNGAVVEVQQLSDIVDDDALIESALPIEPPSQESERQRETQVILNAAKPDRFILDVEFRDFCFFRYKVDGQDALESYYAAGDSFRLDVGRIANIWASNGGAIYARIDGQEISLGRRGEVVVGQVRWFLDEERREYELTFLPLY